MFMRMVPKYDVFVENYGPGVIERLDIGYEAMKAVKAMKASSRWRMKPRKTSMKAKRPRKALKAIQLRVELIGKPLHRNPEIPPEIREYFAGVPHAMVTFYQVTGARPTGPCGGSRGSRSILLLG